MTNHYTRINSVSDDDDDDPLSPDEDYTVCHSISSYCQKCCSFNTLKKRIPIINWLPRYSCNDLKGDVIAGLTVALTVIPQGLALAQLANLPPQYGLYTAFMGCFMYTIFGSCKDLTVGPTAIMSLMTAQHVGDGGVPYVIIMTFLSGFIQFGMGILHLGFLINFISAPVTSGFTSAAAITIATTQLPGLIGVKVKSNGFLETLSKLFSNIQNANYWDAILGIFCVLVLLLLRYFNDLKFRPESTFPIKFRKILETTWWLITTGKNALVVVFCGVLAAVLLLYKISPWSLTQIVEPGLPPFNVPKFSVDIFNNSTNKTYHKDFLEIVQDIGSGLIIIPAISILEAIAIAKAFAKGRKLDASQEMIALGICNVMGSFVSAYPATGSFSRTAINYSSGVRTPFGGVFTGSTVILALCVLSPYFYYIPKASLSAIIFVAVLNMVHYKDIAVIWRTDKWDLLPYFTSFIISLLLGLEYGIMIGVAVSLAKLLYQEAHPVMSFQQKMTSDGDKYMYVKLDRTVFFPSTDLLTSKIAKNIPDGLNKMDCYLVVIDFIHVIDADYTTAVGIKNMIDNLNKENIILYFINVNESIIKAIKGAAPSIFHYSLSDLQIKSIIEKYYTKVSNSTSTSESVINTDELLIDTQNHVTDYNLNNTSG